jgi:hypothetical protein
MKTISIAVGFNPQLPLTAGKCDFEEFLDVFIGLKPYLWETKVPLSKANGNLY